MIFLGIVLTGFMLATGVTPSVVSYDMLEKLGVVCVVLQISEFYRQRFYLDWRNEWGFHWRVAFLQYAKWPWFLLALFDVLCGEQKPYVLTAKVKAQMRTRVLLLPNMAVILFLCAAWVVGQRLGNAVHPLVYIFAAGFVIASVILIWTELWDFPAPYNKELIMTRAPAHVREESGFLLSEKRGSLQAEVQKDVVYATTGPSLTPVSASKNNGPDTLDHPTRQEFMRNEGREDEEI